MISLPKKPTPTTKQVPTHVQLILPERWSSLLQNPCRLAALPTGHLELVLATRPPHTGNFAHSRLLLFQPTKHQEKQVRVPDMPKENTLQA